MLAWLWKHFGGGRRGVVSLRGKCQDFCCVCRVVLKTLVVACRHLHFRGGC